MIVTCCSGHSRNRHVGEELGKGYTLDEVTRNMGMVVAEGVKTTESAWNLARQLNVETPIINEIYHQRVGARCQNFKKVPKEKGQI